jgi:hypothetical protein
MCITASDRIVVVVILYYHRVIAVVGVSEYTPLLPTGISSSGEERQQGKDSSWQSNTNTETNGNLVASAQQPVFPGR